MTLVAEAARGIGPGVAVVLAFAAWTTARNRGSTRTALLALFPVLRDRRSAHVEAAATTVIAVEVLIAVALVVAPSHPVITAAYAVAATGFVIVNVIALRKQVACGCFGRRSRRQTARARSTRSLDLARTRVSQRVRHDVLTRLRRDLRHAVDGDTIRHGDMAWWAADVRRVPQRHGSPRVFLATVPGRRGHLNAVIHEHGPINLTLLTPGGPVSAVTARLDFTGPSAPSPATATTVPERATESAPRATLGALVTTPPQVDDGSTPSERTLT